MIKDIPVYLIILMIIELLLTVVVIERSSFTMKLVHELNFLKKSDQNKDLNIEHEIDKLQFIFLNLSIIKKTKIIKNNKNFSKFLILNTEAKFNLSATKLLFVEIFKTYKIKLIRAVIVTAIIFVFHNMVNNKYLKNLFLIAFIIAIIYIFNSLFCFVKPKVLKPKGY